jgi:hypothetical protein
VKAECSSCGAVQECRTQCPKCQARFCRLCVKWNKKWIKCPKSHELTLLRETPGHTSCDRCMIGIERLTPSFKDKACDLYLHIGCGPYKMKSSSDQGKACYLCYCGRKMDVRVGSYLNSCSLCAKVTNEGVKCSICHIKVCTQCLEKVKM